MSDIQFDLQRELEFVRRWSGQTLQAKVRLGNAIAHLSDDALDDRDISREIIARIHALEAEQAHWLLLAETAFERRVWAFIEHAARRGI